MRPNAGCGADWMAEGAARSSRCSPRTAQSVPRPGRHLGWLRAGDGRRAGVGGTHGQRSGRRGLLADAADIHFLEFEENQTDRDRGVARRTSPPGPPLLWRSAVLTMRQIVVATPVARCPPAPSPRCRAIPPRAPSGACPSPILRSDAGWLTATAIHDDAGNAWSHGMLVARCLGIPIVDETP